MKYLFLVLILFSGCRKDVPPNIDPFVLNGVGVGIYKDPKTGIVTKKVPSEMKGYIAFEPKQLENYVNWCYNPEGN